MLTNVWSQVVLVLYTRVRETRRFCTSVLNTTYFSNESDDYECVESIGYLYLAHMFEKYADLQKARHAVSWRKK